MLSGDMLTAPAEAVVIPMSREVMAQAVEAATALRHGGVSTQLYCEERKFKQKIAYADKSGIPFAVILGEDEAARGEVAVKNMATGEQLSLTPQAAAAHIHAVLEGRRHGRVILG